MKIQAFTTIQRVLSRIRPPKPTCGAMELISQNEDAVRRPVKYFARLIIDASYGVGLGFLAYIKPKGWYGSNYRNRGRSDHLHADPDHLAHFHLQRAGGASEPLPERLQPDRRAAQASLRPDPQPRRNRQGLHVP